MAIAKVKLFQLQTQQQQIVKNKEKLNHQKQTYVHNVRVCLFANILFINNYLLAFFVYVLLLKFQKKINSFKKKNMLNREIN